MHLIKDSLQDYVDLAKLIPDNFYFRLAARLAKYLTPKKDKVPSVEFEIWGNRIQLILSSMNKLIINGREIHSSTSLGTKFLNDAIVTLLGMENQGLVKISRPNGRTRYDDRKDFNLSSDNIIGYDTVNSSQKPIFAKLARGTVFPSLYEDTKYYKGKKNYAQTQDINKALLFRESAWEDAIHRKSLKQDNYVKFSNNYVTFFYKKGTRIFDLSQVSFNNGAPVQMSSSLFRKIVVESYIYYEYWARTPELYDVFEYCQSGKVCILTYKELIFKIYIENDEIKYEEF